MFSSLVILPFHLSRWNLSLSFQVLSCLALPLVHGGCWQFCSQKLSCAQALPFATKFLCLSSCCVSDRRTPQSLFGKCLCTFFSSFFLAFNFLFCFFLFWVVGLLISVLSFCISASGFFFFFLLSQIACFKILNSVWNVVLPFSSALWVFFWRRRDSSAEIRLLAFSEFFKQ